MNLSRPIRVAGDFALAPSSSPDGSKADLLSHRHSHLRSPSASFSMVPGSDGETTFYLPRNVSKGLFLTSKTTAQEVISILLRKFKIVTNPRKFALFERNQGDGTSRRLRRYEEPLVLQLFWGGGNSTMSLYLQENQEDEDFPWEEFSLVELNNFLRFVDNEESQTLAQLETRYERKRLALETAIAQLMSTESSAVTSADEEESAASAAEDTPAP
eukprot:m.64139 g.64139  ORF g.64139 m.64139 type:complete len:215 (+) comp7236_c0_seq2:721-1365(+)